MKILLKTLILALLLSGCASQDPFLKRFDGLQPKATYQDYAIYDLVEQKGLACAEAIEFLGQDEKYDYYFDCLRSDQIFFVSEDEVIKVKTVYAAGLIDLNTLFELGILDRMTKP